MGNYTSCTLPIHNIPNGSGSGSGSSHSKIILPNSEIRDIGKAAATPAAELMLEFPGHFLVSSRSLRVGRGFHALSADEDLEPAGYVYVMFPMHRLSSLVNAADTAPLLAAAAAPGKVVRQQRRRTSTVTPVAAASSTGEEPAAEFVMTSRRSSLCRSRRPVLEPIAEETPVC